MLTSPGCVDDLLSRRSGSDVRFVTIQTLSLFNQREPSRLSKVSWKGDWVFRRERLELIDRELRNIKPDLLILQETMSKIESPSESDRNILLAGALSEYDWHLRVVKEYEDSQEAESMAVAVGLPLRIDRAQTLSRRELWDIGNDGYLVATSVDIDGTPLTVFNVQMPLSENNRDLWYLFIRDRIIERIKDEGSCPRRIVVAGFLPGSQDSARYRDFMTQLQLKDVSASFCEQEGRCYTSTPLNEIFMATIGDERPSRSDRILVHQNTYVKSSGVNFQNSIENHRTKPFGLAYLWPTQRFGWTASVRFSICNSSKS
jgi:endonuclease/exonuclease/phosphatase family metal-dependent hydrolase